MIGKDKEEWPPREEAWTSKLKTKSFVGLIAVMASKA
jgi:hypothetical protein